MQGLRSVQGLRPVHVGGARWRVELSQAAHSTGRVAAEAKAGARAKAGDRAHFCGPLTEPPFSIESNLPPSSIVVAEPCAPRPFNLREAQGEGRGWGGEG